MMVAGAKPRATAALSDSYERVLVHRLEQAGWQLLTFEINLHAATARVELKRFDGRFVTLDARNGKASITREQADTKHVTIGAGWCVSNRGGMPTARTRMLLLGRQRYEGARSAFRALANYIADNAIRGELTRHEAKRLLAPMLSLPGDVENGGDK